METNAAELTVSTQKRTQGHQNTQIPGAGYVSFFLQYWGVYGFLVIRPRAQKITITSLNKMDNGRLAFVFYLEISSLFLSVKHWIKEKDFETAFTNTR